MTEALVTGTTRRDPPVPFAGLRVLELGEFVAVPYAGKMLADLGADVLKVEHPDAGDPSRRYGPFPASAEDDEHSGLFTYLNSNKRSVVFDVGADDGRQRLQRLLSGADVLFIDETFTDRLVPNGTPESLAEQYDRLVVTAVTPFGRSGPYRAYRAADITVSAAGGCSYGVGDADREPLPLPGFQCDFQAGLSAAIATVFALIERATSGSGQLIDISSMEVFASLHTGYYLPRYVFGGGMVGRRSGRTGNSTPYPNTVLPCKDGMVVMAAPQVEQWKRFVHLMGDPEWSTQPRYRNRRAMQWEYREEVDALILPWLQRHTKQDLLELFRDHRIPFAPILTASDLIDNSHLVARQSIGRYALPGGGSCAAPSLPIRLEGAPPAQFRRAPLLGEHTPGADWPPHSAHLVGPHNTSREDDSPTTAIALGPAGPLAGLRVLDLGTAWAGNIAGRVLGDYGADVIKVESWTYMDGSRKGKPILVGDADSGDDGQWPDMQPGFHVMARNKRSVALNLRVPDGITLLKRLVRESDVLLHNFSPGVLERLGLSVDMLQRENPRLVIVGQSMAGDHGPLRDYIGYNGTVKALSGLAGLVGYEGEAPIGMFQGLFSDVVSALTAAWGAAVGIYQRAATGRGRVVDVSQWEATLALVPEPLLVSSLSDVELGPRGARNPLACPYGNYPCAGEDAWLSVAVRSDEEWQRFCGVIEHPELAADARYATLAARLVHRAQVDATVGAWTSTRGAAEATATLQAAGIAALPVMNIADLFIDEHLRERNAWVEVEHPLVGVEPLPGIPWKFSRTPGSVRRRAPLLGEHNEEILAEVAGLTRTDYQRLVATGAIEQQRVPNGATSNPTKERTSGEAGAG
ncbi:MAG: CaiB/BaiF CoA transferase family protein [Dehalococcoidia bacterium]